MLKLHQRASTARPRAELSLVQAKLQPCTRGRRQQTEQQEGKLDGAASYHSAITVSKHSTVTSLSLQAPLKSISKHRLKPKNRQSTLKGGARAPELPISGGSKPLPRRKGSLIVLPQPVSLLRIRGEYKRHLGERKGRTTTCPLVLSFSS